MRGLLANGAPHVGFLDADCEFRPHAPPFEGEYVDDSAILMATGKSGRLNSGVMFGKSTPILIDFLEMLISKADTEVPKEDRTAYENGHFIHYGRSVNFIRVLDHRKWNNNSELDALSYVQHFSGGELRRWWDEQKKWTSSAVPSEGEGKEDVTDISVSEFLFIARKHLSVRYPELVSTQRRVIVN